MTKSTNVKAIIEEVGRVRCKLYVLRTRPYGNYTHVNGEKRNGLQKRPSLNSIFEKQEKTPHHLVANEFTPLFCVIS
jgi:hypothetical protein